MHRALSGGPVDLAKFYALAVGACLSPCLFILIPWLTLFVSFRRWFPLLPLRGENNHKYTCPLGRQMGIIRLSSLNVKAARIY
jgi:hypothetical protein